MPLSWMTMTWLRCSDTLLCVVGLAGRIERFPTRLLPCRASIPQVDCGLVKNCVEPSTISIRRPGRDTGSFAKLLTR